MKKNQALSPLRHRLQKRFLDTDYSRNKWIPLRGLSNSAFRPPLPHTHKSELHRNIVFMLPAKRPTLDCRLLSWILLFFGKAQPGGCGTSNAGIKDWRAGGLDMMGIPVFDHDFTKERRGFLERRRFADSFIYRICFELKAWRKVSSTRHCA